jgi:hypothetical protein
MSPEAIQPDTIALPLVTFQQNLGQPAIAVAATDNDAGMIDDFAGAVTVGVSRALQEVQSLPAGELPPPQRGRDHKHVLKLGDIRVRPNGEVTDVTVDGITPDGTYSHLFVGKGDGDERQLYEPRQTMADEQSDSG